MDVYLQEIWACASGSFARVCLTEVSLPRVIPCIELNVRRIDILVSERSQVSKAKSSDLNEAARAHTRKQEKKKTRVETTIVNRYTHA